MTDLQLYTKISSLPIELKKEVSDFVDFLKHKINYKVDAKHELKKRKAGIAKGLIHMSPDFDEPLEDFKEYM